MALAENDDLLEEFATAATDPALRHPVSAKDCDTKYEEA
jgi:hypothetical protein